MTFLDHKRLPGYHENCNYTYSNPYCNKCGSFDRDVYEREKKLKSDLDDALKALTVSQHSNYNLQQELTETLNVMYEAKCALEVYASDSNWYDRVGNNYITFHDGSDQNLGYDTAREALDLIKSLGEE